MKDEIKVRIGKELLKLRIGKELLKLRIDNDYTIQELSEITDVNKDTLYKYEKGLGNCFDTLEKILSAYNLNFKLFFDRLYANMQNLEEEE